MSIAVQNAVVENAPVKGGEYLLLLILSRYAADNGSRVFPSIETMAKDSRQHERSVQRQLRSLEKKGLIATVCSSKYGTTTYQIVLEKLSTKGGFESTVSHEGVALGTKEGGPESNVGGHAPPDSLDSLLISQKRADKSAVKTNFKTEAGCESLAHIWTFLKKPPTRQPKGEK